MKKNWLILMLVAVLLLTCSCGKKEEPAEDSSANSAPVTTDGSTASAGAASIGSAASTGSAETIGSAETTNDAAAAAPTSQSAPAEPAKAVTAPVYPADRSTESCTYRLLPDGTAMLTGLSQCDDYTLPSEVDGYRITAIGPEALKEVHFNSERPVLIPDSIVRIEPLGLTNVLNVCVSAEHPRFEVRDSALFDKVEKKLVHYLSHTWAESYTIPEGTLAIATGAFVHSPLKLTLPSNVVNIEGNPFCGAYAEQLIIPEGHPNLTYLNSILVDTRDMRAICPEPMSYTGELSIPSEIRIIGDYAFCSCSIDSLKIPDSVQSIGYRAFYRHSSSYRNVPLTLGDGLESIGDEAFLMADFTQVNLPHGLISIGRGAFGGCNGLHTVNIGTSNPRFAVSNGGLYEKTTRRLIACVAPEATSFTVAPGTLTIDPMAIRSLRELKTLQLPDTVVSIGEEAAANVRKLSEVSVYASEETDALFTRSIAEVLAEIPAAQRIVGARAFAENEELRRVTLPNGIFGLCDELFDGSWRLESLTLPESLSFICDNLFSSYYYLQELSLPDTLVYLGASSVIGKDVTIPDAVTHIHSEALTNGIQNLTLPATFTLTDSSIFQNLSNLKTITLAENHPTLKAVDGVLYDQSGSTLLYYPSNRDAESFTVPQGTTAIADYAFYNAKLSSITLPESLQTIGSCAFDSARKLKTIQIPDGVTSIGEAAFRFCESLTSVQLPQGLAAIAPQTFYDCDKLKEINIPAGVTSIGTEAFRFCPALKEIVIPEGVTVIPEAAFASCSGMSSFTFGSAVTTIEANAFLSCRKLSSITLPESLVSIGTEAFAESGLSRIIIPAGVQELGERIFANCTSLYGTTFRPAIEIPRQMYYGCSHLSTLTLSDNCPAIGEEAFAGCDLSGYVTLPKNLQVIGPRAFRDNADMPYITIPQYVTSIGEGAFAGCAKNFSLRVCTGSYGENYALENGYHYTTYAGK